MDEFVRNFVLGMFTESCLCILILNKIIQKYFELHVKACMRLENLFFKLAVFCLMH